MIPVLGSVGTEYTLCVFMPRLARVTKNAPRLVEGEQTKKVEISPVHHVERTCLNGQHIQHIAIAHLAVRDVDESRDVAAQTQKRMQLDGRLGGTKRRPWEKRQAQVDGRGIQGVDRIGEIDTKTLVAIRFARTPDKHCRQIFPDVPVAPVVGIGQRRAFNWRAKAHPVQLFLVG